jgi:hypothetical protein
VSRCLDYDDETRERLTRAILAYPLEVSHALISRELEMFPDTVRRVRFGILWASFAPELQRLTLEQATRTCRTCRLFEHHSYRRKANGKERRFYGHCTLGMPEAKDNHDWARFCEVYLGEGEVVPEAAEACEVTP